MELYEVVYREAHRLPEVLKTVVKIENYIKEYGYVCLSRIRPKSGTSEEFSQSSQHTKWRPFRLSHTTPTTGSSPWG